jgi:hypothetical protein
MRTRTNLLTGVDAATFSVNKGQAGVKPILEKTIGYSIWKVRRQALRKTEPLAEFSPRKHTGRINCW